MKLVQKIRDALAMGPTPGPWQISIETAKGRRVIGKWASNASFSGSDAAGGRSAGSDS